MRSKILKSVVALLFVAALVASIFAPSMPSVYAIVPTPQTFNASRADANVMVWANAKSITATTRWCIDARNYNAADVQWVIDQGTTNTTSLKLQFSNDGLNFTDGATLVSGNAADANELNRQLLYGRYACVLATVTNSNAIVITVLGVAK